MKSTKSYDYKKNTISRLFAIQALFQMEANGKGYSTIKKELKEKFYMHQIQDAEFLKPNYLLVQNIIEQASKNQMKIISIIGKKDGFAAKNSSVKLIFDISEKKNLTPITEGLTSVVWHLLVTHPKLKSNKTKW